MAKKVFQCKHIPDRHVIDLAERCRRGDVVPCVFEALVDEYGARWTKVCIRKIERLVDRGLLDYGTSPAYAWPTDKGLELLEQEGATCR